MTVRLIASLADAHAATGGHRACCGAMQVPADPVPFVPPEYPDPDAPVPIEEPPEPIEVPGDPPPPPMQAGC